MASEPYIRVVTADEFVPDDRADDSPWRPGADVRFDHPPVRPFGVEASPPVRSSPAVSPSRRRRWPVVLVALAVVVAMSVAVVRRPGPQVAGAVAELTRASSDDGPSDAEVATLRDPGGDVSLASGDVPLLTRGPACPARRLPDSVELRWETAVPEARRLVGPLTVGAESFVAVAAFDSSSSSGSAASLIGFDLADGAERWRIDLQPSTGSHEIVGIVDGVVVVRSAAGPDISYRRLFGFDERTGAVLWDRGFVGSWTPLVDDVTNKVYVGVQRPVAASAEMGEVAVLDPRTGDRLHVAAGAFVGTGPEGALVTRAGDEVLASSVKDRALLGAVVPAESPFALAGDGVVVASGAASTLAVSTGVDSTFEERELPLVGSAGITPPGFVVALDGLGGSAVLVAGEGAVYGAQVGDDSVEIRWRAVGVVLDDEPTDRGRSLLVATDGGAGQRVVDASTGRTIVELVLRPGALSTLAMVGNGVIIQDVVDGDAVRTALDLDGRRIWTLPGTGALAVGAGVVVHVVDGDDAIVLRAHGLADPELVDQGCGSVMTEWTPR